MKSTFKAKCRWRAGGWALGLILMGWALRTGAAECASPSKNLVGRIEVDANGRLGWSLMDRGIRVIEPSTLGIVVDGVDLGQGVSLGNPEASEVSEVFPWRGTKRTATNHCRVYLFPVRHGASSTEWQLEARVFDGGFAFRYRVPGSGQRRVKGESTSWTLPAEGEAWFQTNTGDYEGAYQRQRPAAIPRQMPTGSGGREGRPVHLGPPVTVALPTGGYLLVTEANLFRYSGMTLRPTGTPRLDAVFEDDPEGFVMDGEILSPWRVTLVTPDLDSLVNSDVIPGLCEPPDPRLFPDGPYTSWIRPGKALVTWCVFFNDGARWHLQKWFVDQSVALDCGLLLVDAGWRTERWGWMAGGGDAWVRLKELCAYGAERGVGIVVWHAYPEGRDDGPGLTRPEARREFFRRCREAGVAGVKIDFFNSESFEVIRVQEEMLRLAAEHRLSINFHGAHKPTGEVRTWPNEVTREGIREQEYVLWDKLPLEHYAALPFTRLAVGHGDFLPAYVRSKFLRNTTATFQAATAIIATSTFVSLPDHPDDYRASPLLGLIQAMPTVWDETRVLEGSEIGRLAAFARRSGETWFVGVLNGTDEPRSWGTALGFLGNGDYDGTLYRDGSPHPTVASIEVGRKVRAGQRLQAELMPGGGFVAWLKRSP